MSFPFGSGMPQPNQSQQPPSHHHQPNPYHQQQPPYNNQPPAQPFGVGYPNVASYPATSGQYPTFGGAPYPPQGHNNAAPYPTTQHAQYQQYPQTYPAAPIGGVPVYPTLPQHNQHQPQHQYQPPHQAPFGQTLTTTHGGSHQYNNNAPSGHHQTGYGAPSGGFNVACGQQPAAHHQRPATVPAAQQQPKGMPIIRPADNFNAVDDAKALRKAMKGFGTDEDGLIAILCHRSNDQIQHIKSAYKTNFGRDLLEDVRSETSGNFRSVLCALLLPRLDYFAKELNDAMAGLGTDEDALVEILCSLSNYEIQAIRAHYKQVYYKDLESELISETSGHFKRLLVSMVTAGRDESGVVDLDAAQQDATALLRAGELRVGTDESTFNMVLCQRNYAQIRAICDEYQRLTGHSLLKAIDKEFSGDIRDGLMAVVQCMSNKAEFFATRLHKSMAGLGTTDSQLIRVLVMRAEVDLADVKAAFERLYGKSLRSWIKGDTSGHYKHALYHLIGETASSS